jgi:hypothetical protein
MSRFIHFVDDQQRDAEVTFSSLNPKPKVRLVLPNGSDPINLRVIKGTADTGVDALCNRLVGPAKSKKDAAELMREIELADHLIKGDPEVDMELHGKFITDSARVFVNQESKPVFHLKQVERIFDAKGELMEERTPKVFLANISESDMVRWSGKMIPKKELVQKVIFSKKYQVKHINGLTFSFLYDLAKSLDDKQALMPVGTGAKGNQPLVMSDGGKPYRAFLEGRIRGEAYCLLMHLTDQELKAPTE